MSKATDSAHITSKTLLPTAINGWEMFMNDQGRSSNTVKAFLSDVRLLTQFLAPDQSIGAITTDDLNRFFAWMEKERGIPCSPKTLSRRITSVKSFFRWLHQHGTLTLDPAEKVLQRSAISPLPQVLTEDEYEAVLLAADRHAVRESQMPVSTPWFIFCSARPSRKANVLAYTLTILTCRRRMARIFLCAMPAQQIDTRNER